MPLFEFYADADIYPTSFLLIYLVLFTVKSEFGIVCYFDHYLLRFCYITEGFFSVFVGQFHRETIQPHEHMARHHKMILDASLQGLGRWMFGGGIVKGGGGQIIL